jgi:hypothetical protein
MVQNVYILVLSKALRLNYIQESFGTAIICVNDENGQTAK